MNQITPQVQAILARARQLTDFRWTPIRDIPTYSRKTGYKVLPAGVEVQGFPYASTEYINKFITENVSFESFLTAIANPHSKLYQPGHASFHACNFGVVCNGFVRYCLGIRRRVPTFRWFTIPGMRKVADEGTYTVDALQLCDILHAYGKGRNHVSLITGFEKDALGNVTKIEVSEAVRPLCKRASYTPEEFYEAFKLFGICRYDKLKEVPLLNEAEDAVLQKEALHKITPRIAVDNGNKSNYILGEEVLLSVFTDGLDRVLLHRDGELAATYPTDGRAFFPLHPEKGYYTATLETEGSQVQFCVNCADISFAVKDDVLTVRADPQDSRSRMLYMDFRRKGEGTGPMESYEELTPEEIASNTFSRTIPNAAENFKVYYENEYGIWAHPMTPIRK